MVTENVFRGGHLEFLNLSGNRLSDVVVPAIFEISIPKNPLGQSFMLSSQSARQFHQAAPLRGGGLDMILDVDVYHVYIGLKKHTS